MSMKIFFVLLSVELWSYGFGDVAPVGKWPFDSTDQAKDVTGNGNNGVLYDVKLAEGPYGAPQSSYELAGTAASYIVLTGNTLDVGGEYTFTGWLYPDSSLTDGPIFHWNRASKWPNHIWVVPGPRFFHRSANGEANVDTAIYGDFLPVRTWSFVAVSLSVQNSRQRMYIGSATDTALMEESNTIPDGVVPYTSGNVRVGAAAPGVPGSGRNYKGRVACFQFFDSELSLEDIQKAQESCPDKDDCASSPCKNGGQCTDGVNEFTCTCAAGFEGDTCETDKNECALSPCKNGGQCTDAVNGFTCACADGFEGNTCETDKDECASSPCKNGGQCTDAVNGFTCACADGFEGDTCETDKDECASSPCKNGGQCTDKVNAFTCTCADGFEGDTCETDKDDCASSPCKNGGQCTDAVNGFTCACADGFEGDTCETGTATGTCEEGWETYEGNCYSFVTNRASSARASLKKCSAADAGLLKIESVAEFEWIKSTIKGNEDLAEFKWWTSGKLKNGGYRWLSAPVTPVTVFQWAEGQPDETKGKLSCISLQPANDYKYSDGSCGEKMGYICKKPLSD